jgi:hypothetical protein
MEGRWTIKPERLTGVNGGSVILSVAYGPVVEVATPVVPCDDAAVERAAAYLRSISLNDPPHFHGDRRSLAEAVLRAAGESP